MKLWLDDHRFIDTKKGMDISIPLKKGKDNVNAWYCDPVHISPVQTGNFIGDVNQGGSVNFNTISLNPHGNGTHTECVGHISKEKHSINNCLREFYFKALLISVEPEKIDGDEVITAELLLKELSMYANEEALIIRTLPNPKTKLKKQYSGTNPPYISQDAMMKINEIGIKHLLIDLPSVDREDDGGVVAAHHIFWNYPDDPQTDKTITELVYIEDVIKDGHYFLTFQIASLENDASPSKIVLYSVQNK